MKKIIGWALDLLFGPAGEDYVSPTSATVGGQEIILLEPELSPLILKTKTTTQGAKFEWLNDERERLCACRAGPESGCACTLAEIEHLEAQLAVIECRFCGPVCICGGRRRS